MTTARTKIMINAKNLIWYGTEQNGLGLVGAAEAMEKQRGDSFQNVTQVAGSCFGAIIALMLALNFTAAEIKKLYLNLNFNKDIDGINLRKFVQELLIKKDCAINVTFAELAAKGFKNLYLATTVNIKEGDSERTEPFYFSPQATPKTPVLAVVIASVALFDLYPPVYLKVIERGKFVEVEKGFGYKYTAGVTPETKDAYKIFGAEIPKGGTVTIYNSKEDTFEYNPSSSEKKRALQKGKDGLHNFFTPKADSAQTEETDHYSRLLSTGYSDGEDPKRGCVIS